ncbi:MAG: AraC family transcriptional regulator [Clostridia bacterium]|nr:AraC family transcriptional regulator [Clostridia bacterium]
MDHWLTIKSALDFIENRVAEDIQQGQVARVLGFSLSHSRAVFAKATGETISRYITGRRLSHAAFELMNTGKLVSDIAMDYGFASHDSFTRAFRRAFGEPPARFRQQRRPVSSTMITQGIYGPAVQSMQEKVILMDRAHTHELDSSVLYGVPQVSYFSTENECTPFPSVLKACLGFMGQPTTYHHLMAITGAAFRLLWNSEYWDGGNVDILGIRLDATEPLRRAMDSVGRDYTLLCKTEHTALPRGGRGDSGQVRTGDKPAFVELIKREIDAGRPVIGFGIIGPPEACIITGYRNGGETLLGWNFFQEMPEFAAGIEREPCGYFVREGWYEHPDTIAILALGEQKDEPLDKDLLVDTLTYALEIMETPKAHERTAGFAAYGAWAHDLLRESEFPKGAPLPMLMERLMCQADGVTMIGERWQAFRFMEEQAVLSPTAKIELEEAAQLFRQESRLALQMGEAIGGIRMGEKQALTLAKREIREALVHLIQQARELDMRAAEHMKRALQLLS